MIDRTVWLFYMVTQPVFDTLFVPLRWLPPWLGLCLVSLATGVIMLLVFRYASNQRGIVAAKDRIKAYLLEIRLFKDEPILVLHAQQYILGAILRYLGYSVKPVLVLLVPLIIWLLQLNLLYGYQPLRPGESAIVSITLRDKLSWQDMNVQLTTPAEIVAETPPLRIVDQRRVDWRVRAARNGAFDLVFRIGNQVVRKEVRVGDQVTRVSPVRREARIPESFLDEGEPPIPRDSGVETIRVGYRPRSIDFFGWRAQWIVLFVLLSLLAGYGLQGVLRVRI
jgi:hypothetical protein